MEKASNIQVRRNNTVPLKSGIRELRFTQRVLTPVFRCSATSERASLTKRATCEPALVPPVRWCSTDIDGVFPLCQTSRCTLSRMWSYLTLNNPENEGFCSPLFTKMVNWGLKRWGALLKAVPANKSGRTGIESQLSLDQVPFCGVPWFLPRVNHLLWTASTAQHSLIYHSGTRRELEATLQMQRAFLMCMWWSKKNMKSECGQIWFESWPHQWPVVNLWL